MALAERKKRTRRISPRREITEVLRVRRGFERKLETSLGRFAKQLADHASEEFSRTQGYDSDLLIGRLDQVLLPHYREVINFFAERVLVNLENRRVKLDFDTLVRQYMAEHGGQRIARVWARYKREIAKEIAIGQREGESVPKIAKRLRDSKLIDNKLRAATIARTETHNASQYANHEMHKEYMPSNALKQWVSVSDPRTRHHHAAMNGKKVGIDEDFEVMTNGIPVRMAYAGDPRGGAANVINCRCQVIYLEPEDEIVEEQVTSSDEPWMYRDKLKPEFVRNQSPHHEWNEATTTIRNYGKTLGLDEDEVDAVFNYTTGAYAQINRQMREWFYGENISQEARSHLLGYHLKVKSALEKLPPYKGTVRRAISIPNAHVEKFLKDNNIKAGGTLRTESFYSTTSAEYNKFSGSITYTIESKTGRDISRMSAYQSEEEVLFLAGQEFEVVEINFRKLPDRNGNFKVRGADIVLREINDTIKTDYPVTIPEILPYEEKASNISRRFLRKMTQQEALISIDTVLIRGM